MEKDIFRKEMAEFKPYVQGKPAESVKREYGLEKIEKLASNENPFGPSPKAIHAIKKELDNINVYPEGRPVELINKIAKYVGTEPEKVAVGNGGEGLLWSIAMALINEGDDAIVNTPSFDVYNISVSLMGGNIIKVPLIDKSFDIKKIVDSVTEKTKIIYLCTPNNPTGNILSIEEIEYIINNISDDIVLLIDEAYYDFACAFPEYPKNNIKIIDKRPNTIILRTFSKIFGIAGIRIGYAITSELIAEKLNAVKQTFGVNKLAIAGAAAALDDNEYLEMVVKENKACLEVLKKYADSRGIDYFPAYGNFIWMKINMDSSELFEKLQKKGIIIRPGYLWGWQDWIRVSTGTKKQIDFFMEKMDEVLTK